MSVTAVWVSILRYPVGIISRHSQQSQASDSVLHWSVQGNVTFSLRYSQMFMSSCRWYQNPNLDVSQVLAVALMLVQQSLCMMSQQNSWPPLSSQTPLTATTNLLPHLQMPRPYLLEKSILKPNHECMPSLQILKPMNSWMHCLSV
jgi:hypothetical protein